MKFLHSRQYADCIVFRQKYINEVNSMYYSWLSKALKEEFEIIKRLKESERGTVTLVRHRRTGKRFILRSFTGNAEVYQKLLNCTCPNLPQICEAASQGDQNLVLEEYIQGDNMGTMLQEALFTPKETRRILRQLCGALWVLHSMGAVHRDVKPENKSDRSHVVL